MDICTEITRRRDCGKVRCGIRSMASASVAGVAREFALSANGACYREVDAGVAHAIAVHVIHLDLAYHTAVVPLETAEELASAFLARAGSPSCRYFTNGDFSQTSSAEWTPATSATFDTGLIVVGPDRSACLWVEDED